MAHLSNPVVQSRMLPRPKLFTVIVFVSSAGPLSRIQKVSAAVLPLSSNNPEPHFAQVTLSEPGGNAEARSEDFKSATFPLESLAGLVSLDLSVGDNHRAAEAGQKAVLHVIGATELALLPLTRLLYLSAGKESGGGRLLFNGGSPSGDDGSSMGSGMNEFAADGFNGHASAAVWDDVLAKSPVLENLSGSDQGGKAFGSVSFAYDLNAPANDEDAVFSSEVAELNASVAEYVSGATTNNFTSAFSSGTQPPGGGGGGGGFMPAPTEMPEPSSAALFVAALGIGCLFKIRRQKPSDTPSDARWRSCYHPLRKVPSDRDR